MAGRKAIYSEMAGMAKSLERDPRLESILAARKAQLGVMIDSGRRLELSWRSIMASKSGEHEELDVKAASAS